MRSLLSLLILFFVFDFSIAQQEADILLNGVISAEENQIKNLADPTDPNDAANKAYVDDKIFPDGVNDGDILVWNSSTNSWEITTLDNNLSNGTSEVETIEATNITFNSAQAGGVISTDGGSTITEKGIVWSENADPTVDSETKTNEGGGASNFESILTGLNGSTEYFYRAYATNSSGTAYGNTYVFQTDSAAGYDQDGDGYTPEQGDCNDLDPLINPGAEDSDLEPDGIDNDCDGIIDPCGFNGDLDSNLYTGFNPTFTNYNESGSNFEVTLTQVSENSFYISSAWGPNFIEDVTDNTGSYIGLYQYPATITINEDFSISVVAEYEQTAAVSEGTVSSGIFDPCSQTFYYQLPQSIFSGDVGNVAVLLTNDLENTNTADEDGDGYYADFGDCNDYNPSVYPGAQEILDGFDNDCDGFVDYDDDSLQYCGNGITEPGIGEQCDDANDNPYDGCDNCQISYYIDCPPGEYLIQMWDGYGDGWQGQGIEMIINGESSFYTIPEGNYNSATVNIEVEVISQFQWFWTGDDWPNEVVFSITTPTGEEYMFKGSDNMALYTNGLFPQNIDSAVTIYPGNLPIVCDNN
jgi:cysteine-rich repeat protein